MLVHHTHSVAVIFTLERAAYTILEGNNTLSICIDMVVGQLDREVPFNISFQDITTEGIVYTRIHAEYAIISQVGDTHFLFYIDDDYIPQDFTFTFLSSINRMCVDILIIDDGRLEDDEQFSVEISSDDRVDFGLSTSTITIVDNDSKIRTNIQ